MAGYLPVQIGTDSDWQDVSAGSSYVVAQKADGSLWHWGVPLYNVGTLNTDMPGLSTPTRIDTALDWAVAEAGGQSYGLGLKADGSLWSWGTNIWGQLGDGTAFVKNPTRVMLP